MKAIRWSAALLLVPGGLSFPLQASRLRAVTSARVAVTDTVQPRALPSTEEIPIELAPYPEGGTIRRVVPPGVILTVRLVSRPPATPFQIEAQVSARPSSQHDIAAAAAPLSMPTGLGPECRPNEEALGSLVVAQRVAEADRAERAFEAASKRLYCSQLATAAQAAWALSRPRIPSQWKLDPGQELKLTIREQVAQGSPSATWTVTLVAQAEALEWTHSNEEEWLAAVVVRGVTDLLSLTSAAPSAPAATVKFVRRSPSGNGVVQVDVVVAPDHRLSQEIVLEPHVFSPGAYEAFTRALFESLRTRVSKPKVSSGLLDRLTDLRGETLRRESARIATWLSERPLDPAANEAAALVHLALCLRENAGRFTDVRFGLARATSHLVIAGLAGSSPSAEGWFAQAALQVLAHRQADVLPSLQSRLHDPRTPPAEHAWCRALILRVTDDWRIARPGERLTLMERLQLFRARKASLGGLLALDMFAGQPPDPVADWSWTALLSRGASVEEGNMFAPTAFSETLEELSKVVLDKVDEIASPEEVASVLQPGAPSAVAVWSGGRGSAQVLDRATWGAFFARHLVHTADDADRHFRKWLGVPQQADAFLARVDPYLNGTPWGSALQRARQDQDLMAYRPATCGPFVDWVRRYPETVAAAVWNRYFETCKESQWGSLPPMERWFVGPVLPGTALGLGERTETRAVLGFDAIIAQLRKLAPYDEDVARVAIVYGGKQDDAAAITEAFGERKDYSTSVLRRLAEAERAHPDQRRPLLERLCQISPDECLKIAADLVGEERPAEAAEMYERALKEARDRVLVSQSMDWLAAYYLDRGRPGEAERVGQEAASVGSGGGLELLGTVLERLGRLAEAEVIFKSVEQRYDDRKPLDLFYIRAQHLKDGAAFEPPARRAMERIFPSGLERVALDELHDLPTNGVQIDDDAEMVRKLGLAKGDVIVALDGYRTRNFMQYRAVRGLSQDQKIDLIAWSWSSKRYVTAEGRFLNRRFGATLGDFPEQ